MKNTKKLTLCAILSCIAIIFSYIESLFPLPFYVPGVKWGFSNIVILSALYILNFKYSFFIMLIKVSVASILFSSPSVFIYSFLGGVLSLLFMMLFKKQKFNIISVSVAGGISHNIGQLLASAMMMKSLSVFYYLPVLLISGFVTALITGFLSHSILKVLPRLK